jgi:hypothetical protein
VCVCAYDKKCVCVRACVRVCAFDKKRDRQDKKGEREREAKATGGVAEEREREKEAGGLEREGVGMACADVDARGVLLPNNLPSTTQQPAFYSPLDILVPNARYSSTSTLTCSR